MNPSAPASETHNADGLSDIDGPDCHALRNRHARSRLSERAIRVTTSARPISSVAWRSQAGSTARRAAQLLNGAVALPSRTSTGTVATRKTVS
jgi:hypothetical protein